MVASSATQTTVTFSANVTAVASHRISFTNVNHQNLLRRWRWYLLKDLQPSNHSLIQSAVLNALTDTSVNAVIFQTVEDTAQKVLVNTEYLTTGDADDSNLVIGTKYISVTLITPRTTAPDPLDKQ